MDLQNSSSLSQSVRAYAQLVFRHTIKKTQVQLYPQIHVYSRPANLLRTMLCHFSMIFSSEAGFVRVPRGPWRTWHLSSMYSYRQMWLYRSLNDSRYGKIKMKMMIQIHYTRFMVPSCLIEIRYGQRSQSRNYSSGKPCATFELVLALTLRFELLQTYNCIINSMGFQWFSKA